MATVSSDIQRGCPVCLESFSVPIYQCFNGHLVCKICTPRLQTCPVCRDKMPARRIRNLQADNIVVALPFTCRNQDAGCRNLIKHEAIDCAFASDHFCSFLGIPKCREMVKRVDFNSHLMVSHGILMISTTAGETVQVFQYGATLKQVEDAVVDWKTNCIVQGENSFFLRTKVTSESVISWVVHVLGSDDVAKQFRAKIKLFSPDSNAKERYFEWSGQVFGLKSNVNDECHTFNIRAKLLKPILGKSRLSGVEGFLLNVTIFRNETEIGDSSQQQQNPTRIYSKAFRSIGVIHTNLQCGSCGTKSFTGTRYKCIECPRYDLCSSCAYKDNNHKFHLFLMIFSPNQLPQLLDALKKLRRVSRGWGTVNENRQIHAGIACDGCEMQLLTGPRHKCTSCPEYNLCANCPGTTLHHHDLFLVVLSPCATIKLRSAFEVLFGNSG